MKKSLNEMEFQAKEANEFAAWCGLGASTISGWKKLRSPPIYALRLYRAWRKEQDIEIIHKFAKILEEAARVLKEV